MMAQSDMLATVTEEMPRAGLQMTEQCSILEIEMLLRE